MRIVHLFGNWKWTGPAEPVLHLAEEQSDSHVLLGHCPHADLEHIVARHARERGVPHTVLRHLRKHRNPLRTPRATAEVLTHLQPHPPEVLHVHLDSDHVVARHVCRRIRPTPAVIRTVHDRQPLSRSRKRLLVECQLVVAPSPALAAKIEQDLGWPAGSVAVVETGVDLERFQSDDARAQRGRLNLGLDPDDFAWGIVARVQPHRRYELLVEAWSQMKNVPNAPKLVVLGRGTHEEELLHEPVRKAGLESLVLRPGYQEGEAYVDALAACDAALFLVPGSDVSCRAVREWMAMGKGVLGSHRPPIPELIEPGQTGQLVAEETAAIAEALVQDGAREQWRQFGVQARRTAEERFDKTRAARRMERLASMAVLAQAGRASRHLGNEQVVAAVSPGHLSLLEQWANQNDRSLEDIAAFAPRSSRDVGYDLMTLLLRTNAQQVVLEPHPEWDAPLLDELRERGIAVHVLRSTPAESPQDRWLDNLARATGAG